MKKTCLYDEHIKLGAKIVSFEGWQMPLSYESAIKEHNWVREHVGLFDISHMAKIYVRGEKSEAYLNFLGVNDTSKLQDGQAQYTVLCCENGGSIDDVLVYRESQDTFFVVVNASNREKDLKHFLKYSEEYGVEISPEFEGQGILAIQGPGSKGLLKKYWEKVDGLKFMRFFKADLQGNEVTIARSGYTGEIGYEVYGPCHAIVSFWKELLTHSDVVKPIGLSARDILRLEMGFCLYGHELADGIAPVESLAHWVVKFDKPDFLGKEALIKINENPTKKTAYAIKLAENAIAREGVEVLINGVAKGIVTSGTYSPSLKRSIALIIMDGPLEESDTLQVSIRGREIDAEKVQLPFLKK